MGSKSDVKLSFLFSYAYIRMSNGLLMDAIQALSNVSRVMIDSGAYTNFKSTVRHAKAQKVYVPITLPEYIGACKNFSTCYQYIMLDVIGNPVETLVNYNAMRNAGLTPMPVFTRGAPWQDLAYYASQWKDICYGGIVSHSKNHVFVQNITQGMAVTNNVARFHLLGFARYPLVMSLPIQSFDSSSYAAGQQYGRLAIFTPQSGISSFGKEEDTLKYLAWLHRHNIDQNMLKTGHWLGQRGMPTMATMYSHLEMMSYVLQTKGQFYFLAVPNMHLLEAILSVYASRTKQGFDYPMALERYNEVHSSHKTPNRTIELLLEYVDG
jgi:hypothetical protein